MASEQFPSTILDPPSSLSRRSSTSPPGRYSHRVERALYRLPTPNRTVDPCQGSLSPFLTSQRSSPLSWLFLGHCIHLFFKNMAYNNIRIRQAGRGSTSIITSGTSTVAGAPTGSSFLLDTFTNSIPFTQVRHPGPPFAFYSYRFLENSLFPTSFRCARPGSYVLQA